MANTVSLLSYSNTFGEWFVLTNSLAKEYNDLAANNYIKDSGTLYLNDTTLGLQVKTDAVIQRQLRVSGTGSSAYIQNNLEVERGQVYFSNTTLGLINSGQTIIGGTITQTGSTLSGNSTGISIANNATFNGTITANGVSNLRSSLFVAGNTVISNTVFISGNTSFSNSISIGITANANNLIVVNDANVKNNLYVFDSTQSGTLYSNYSTTVGTNLNVINTSYTNYLQANTRINTPLLTVSGQSILDTVQANTRINTPLLTVSGQGILDTVQANTRINTPLLTVSGQGILDTVQANTRINTSILTSTNIIYGNNIQANTNLQTQTLNVIGTEYANVVVANTRIETPTLVVTSGLYANNADVITKSLQTNGQLTVGGNFVLNGTTIYNTNTFTINAGSSIGLDSVFSVKRGTSGSNAEIKWSESNRQFNILDVNSNTYNIILTSGHINNSVSNTSSGVVASALTANTLNENIKLANTQLKAYTDGLVSTSIASANTQLKAYTDGLVSTSIASANTQLKAYSDGAFYSKTGGNISGSVTISSDLTVSGNLIVSGSGTLSAAAGLLTGSTLASGVTISSLTAVGTITSGTWSGSFGAVSGANLTGLTAGNLSGTIPSAVLANSSVFIGTTSIALNRASASQTLTGISIDGNAGTVTNGVYTSRSINTSAPLSGGGNLTADRTLSLASGYGDTQNPFGSKTANFFLAAPNGTSGAPTFRAIVAADIPTLNQNTTGTASNITAHTINQSVGTGNSPTFAGLTLNGSISTTVAAGSTRDILSATIADSDYFRLRVGGTANAGWAELAMADDGTEPFYIRQYTGVFTSVSREALILGASGETSFPVQVTSPKFFASNYFRSTGNTGWYNETYGGGIYMQDSTYVRTYGSKQFYCDSAVHGTIFYDANNGAFYLDPNGTSVLSGADIQGGWNFRSSQNTAHGGQAGNLCAFGPSSAAATMSFHRAGAYAVNMGLDTDNVFRIGGWSAGANRIQLDMSGNFTAAGNVTAYSDIKLKTNIVTIKNALENVTKMRGVNFTRIDTEENGTGVIAQEMKEIVPEVVMEDSDGNLSVAYGNLVGYLIEAIKELKTEINQLKGK